MPSQYFPSFQLSLPAWVDDVVGDPNRAFDSLEERMDLAVALSRRSYQEGGGPFGAAVFDLDSGRLVSPGVNQVVAAHCSAAHAEVVALILAQQVRGTFDLAAGAGCQLVTSTEPCAQCLGAIPWSGVKSVVCGARGDDAEGIGFDEGAKPEPWTVGLDRRGIEVIRDVRREAAHQVLLDYAASGGPIYNAGD